MNIANKDNIKKIAIEFQQTSMWTFNEHSDSQNIYSK